MTSNDARKLGLITVIWARTPPPPQKKKKIDQVSELPVVVFVLTRPCRGLESFLAFSRHLLFNKVKQNSNEDVEVTVYR